MNNKHARALCQAFLEKGVESKVVDGKTGKLARDFAFAQLENGEISVICSVGVMSEGTDLPFVSCLLCLRNTDSRGMFIQQVGRGLRIHPSKQDCLILDEVGNSWKHGGKFRGNSELCVVLCI